MAASLLFSPLVPWPVIVALGAIALLLVAAGAVLRARGTAFRLLAFVAALLALANPSLLQETREPLDDVVALVVDRSQSQSIGTRTDVSDAALERLKERLGGDGIDLKLIEAGNEPGADGTHLFGAIEAELGETPPERVGAVILLTDGQVHDVPASAAAIGLEAPVHTLITGRRDESDRRLTIVSSPRFGIVEEDLEFVVRVDDVGSGAPAAGGTASLTLRFDGGAPETRRIALGSDMAITFRLAHGGANVIEVEVEAGPAELTLENNRAVIVTNGIRDRLRVLLVSGEPHAGERTWRNLLKADPSVELVHFTILRPPEKQDLTPNHELALIGFPVRELFSERLYDFDLIIFDRYRQREVISGIYFSYMADYVERGGALLVSSGPDLASPYSIATTALSPLLPAQPRERVLEGGYRPRVTDEGHRHPVTAALPGANRAGAGAAEATWGRWFRLVDSEIAFGRTLMTGAEERPLLVLGEAGEGRVAQLLSDHTWLWARGLEGGGPQAELLRRLAHWLMKEPDLEEEVLTGTVQGKTLTITRRTMAEAAAPVEVTRPGGAVTRVPLEPSGPGRFGASLAVDEVGLYRLSDGTMTTIVAVGPLNPKEVADMRASEDLMKPIADETGGGLYWVGGANGLADMPAVRFVREGRALAGRDWLGVRRNEAYVVTAADETALVSPYLAAAVIVLLFLAAWRREST